ncbi:hypothetical protein GJAV_G00040660 [Gymnothorax javanicus]|nr:hypothetical protein GJAV_G00040660 [Gymnothorax javanicus]
MRAASSSDQSVHFDLGGFPGSVEEEDINRVSEEDYQLLDLSFKEAALSQKDLCPVLVSLSPLQPRTGVELSFAVVVHLPMK